MELTRLSLSEAAELLEQRSVSPVELAQAHLARIAALDRHINSFITVSAEQALQQAQQAETEIVRGDYRGPLHGLPVALKDLLETEGLRTTAGSRFLRDYVPQADAAVVQRLRAAGAVVLGKLNMHEWAMSVTNNNPHYGPCRNPWDLERIPGGSSGGSGAALAAELCSGALGSDSGGSIRIPAALCGVVGLKPTYGRVSTRGAIPLSWSLDHIGPMGRRVRDVAMLLQVMAGHDPDDPYSVEQPVDDYQAQLEGGVRGWRVALAWQGFLSRSKQPQAEVQAALLAAGRLFEQLGAQVDELELPGAYEAQQLAGWMITSDAALFHEQRMQQRPEDFGPDVREALERGAARPAHDYARARRAQALFSHQLAQLFASYDLLLTPATATTAPLIDEPAESRIARPSLTCYTAPFNLAGLPALALPCGFSGAGLPIGLQLVGRRWAEAQLLRAGYAFEQASSWHRQRPDRVSF